MAKTLLGGHDKTPPCTHDIAERYHIFHTIRAVQGTKRNHLSSDAWGMAGWRPEVDEQVQEEVAAVAQEQGHYVLPGVGRQNVSVTLQLWHRLCVWAQGTLGGTKNRAKVKM